MSLIDYFKDTKSELKHVSWPNKQQTINFTIIVVLISLLTGLLLGFFDLIYQFVLKTFVLQ
ncbi:MAG: preprotein translocase subunit SecE [Candidatus Vogelbacteria bacterium CG10_big_fil_rev_8_21_14_0_10_49_38]|uniref:Protein translocase subunit SecE n=1 Tax=Candidatus Vogelbacteria bacterium CG10_big_fil_rev_8_21_14_0_10_49_38 TaxID=1975043 RepID=A0A2H0RKH9_9BACT|nr:MAG: preprotein translocase subunit SecE [bacterium CG10_49_38]PIR46285.1 MAG: preprotein translocase subunit SecE [Candidatus Vogelbacteria bacterium CG10_big_fil_rev_8_21_14_0_10_49_38]